MKKMLFASIACVFIFTATRPTEGTWYQSSSTGVGCPLKPPDFSSEPPIRWGRSPSA